MTEQYRPQGIFLSALPARDNVLKYMLKHVIGRDPSYGGLIEEKREREAQALMTCFSDFDSRIGVIAQDALAVQNCAADVNIALDFNQFAVMVKGMAERKMPIEAVVCNGLIDGKGNTIYDYLVPDLMWKCTQTCPPGRQTVFVICVPDQEVYRTSAFDEEEQRVAEEHLKRCNAVVERFRKATPPACSPFIVYLHDRRMSTSMRLLTSIVSDKQQYLDNTPIDMSSEADFLVPVAPVDPEQEKRKLDEIVNIIRPALYEAMNAPDKDPAEYTADDKAKMEKITSSIDEALSNAAKAHQELKKKPNRAQVTQGLLDMLRAWNEKKDQ